MAGSPTVFDPKMKCYCHVANVASLSANAAATYDATTQTLVANLRTATNTLLAAFKSAGIMAVD